MNLPSGVLMQETFKVASYDASRTAITWSTLFSGLEEGNLIATFVVHMKASKRAIWLQLGKVFVVEPTHECILAIHFGLSRDRALL